MAVDPRRLRAHGSRQLAATLASHHAHLYSAQLDAGELAALRDDAGTPRGLVDDGEPGVVRAEVGDQEDAGLPGEPQAPGPPAPARGPGALLGEEPGVEELLDPQRDAGGGEAGEPGELGPRFRLTGGHQPQEPRRSVVSAVAHPR